MDNLVEGSFHTLKTNAADVFPVIFNSGHELLLETQCSFVFSLLRDTLGFIVDQF